MFWWVFSGLVKDEDGDAICIVISLPQSLIPSIKAVIFFPSRFQLFSIVHLFLHCPFIGVGGWCTAPCSAPSSRPFR